MKKLAKKVMVIFLVLLIVTAGLCWWQWNNIAALKTSFIYSREDITLLMEENDKKVADVSNQVEGVTVRDLTEEEKAALLDESVDRDELIDRLIAGGAAVEEERAEVPPVSEKEETVADGETTASKQEQPKMEPVKQETQKPSPTDTPVKNEQMEQIFDPRRQELSRLIAEIYLMKSEYTAWLEQKHTDAIEEYVALPKAEQTTANKYKIGMAYMKEGLAKEVECDGLMAEIQAKIKAILVDLGEDTSLVNEIQATYEKEKELKKAYYLGLHK